MVLPQKMRTAVNRFLKNPSVDSFSAISRVSPALREPGEKRNLLPCSLQGLGCSEHAHPIRCPITDGLPGDYYWVCGKWTQLEAIKEKHLAIAILQIVRWLAWLKEETPTTTEKRVEQKN